MWKAPFTGGYEKTIPLGLQFVVAFEPPASATAVIADAEPYSDWEKFLVDAKDRADPKFNGYYFSIPFDQIERHCTRVT